MVPPPCTTTIRARQGPRICRCVRRPQLFPQQPGQQPRLTLIGPHAEGRRRHSFTINEGEHDVQAQDRDRGHDGGGRRCRGDAGRSGGAGRRSAQLPGGHPAHRQRRAVRSRAEQFTRFTNFGSSASNFAGDSNNFDPDGVRINLNTSLNTLLGQVDFRIGGQASDNGGEFGPVLYTSWASEGGGQTGQITDGNGFDPDQYRVFVEVRPLPAGVVIDDFRLSVLRWTPARARRSRR